MKRLRLALSLLVAGCHQPTQARPGFGAVYQAFGSGVPAAPPINRYIQQGISLAGISGDYTIWADDFTNGTEAGDTIAGCPVGWNTLTFSGTAAMGSATNGRGELLLTATGAASSLWIQNNMDLIGNPSIDPYYVAASLIINTAIASTDSYQFGFRDRAQAKGLTIGYTGGSDATNLIVLYDGDFAAGTKLSTGVAAGNSRVIIELWNTPGTPLQLNIRVNGGAVAQATQAAASTVALRPVMRVAAGAAGAHSAQWDWFALVTKRSP